VNPKIYLSGPVYATPESVCHSPESEASALSTPGPALQAGRLYRPAPLQMPAFWAQIPLPGAVLPNLTETRRRLGNEASSLNPDDHGAE
jgi:hypothetical protein